MNETAVVRQKRGFDELQINVVRLVGQDANEIFAGQLGQIKIQRVGNKKIVATGANDVFGNAETLAVRLTVLAIQITQGVFHCHETVEFRRVQPSRDILIDIV